MFCQIKLSGYVPTLSTKEACSVRNIRQCTKLKDQVILKEMVVRVVYENSLCTVLLDLIFIGSVSVSLIHEAGKLANIRSQSETSLFPGHYFFIGFGVSSLCTVHAYHSSSILFARSVHVRLPLFIQLLKSGMENNSSHWKLFFM